MKPTGFTVLLLCVLPAALAGYLLGVVAYSDLPPLPRFAPLDRKSVV